MTRILRWGLGGLGVLVMCVACRGILGDARETHPLGLVVWLGGSVALSDLLIAPVVLLVGVVVVRVVPVAARTAVSLGLMIAGPVLLIGLVVLFASRRARGNPTVLPLDYSTGLAVTLLLIASVTSAGALLSVWAARRTGREPVRAPGRD